MSIYLYSLNGLYLCIFWIGANTIQRIQRFRHKQEKIFKKLMILFYKSKYNTIIFMHIKLNITIMIRGTINKMGILYSFILWWKKTFFLGWYCLSQWFLCGLLTNQAWEFWVVRLVKPTYHLVDVGIVAKILGPLLLLTENSTYSKYIIVDLPKILLDLMKILLDLIISNNEDWKKVKNVEEWQMTSLGKKEALNGFIGLGFQYRNLFHVSRWSSFARVNLLSTNLVLELDYLRSN